MTLALVFDAIVAALLAATIGFAVVLNRKLSGLRAAREEMARLAERFAQAIAAAETGLGDMRKLADQNGEILERRIAQAQGVRDDLAFLLESAAGTADRLERARAAARKASAKAVPALPKEAAPEMEVNPTEVSPARRALLETLQTMR